ncbi:uncharacterized protein LOC132643924 [Lycium barbarum]|uniref:uncharacterized protein LOC132643924 n=1 Tax=Lycium barbarum TaxID=112863 RepID=UPI00293F3EF3|nr:uncharacterized protein LOC132643924 [Lycium barbarum]
MTMITFVFKFATEGDKEEILENGPYTFQNRPLIIREWTSDFEVSKEPQRIVPIWVNLPRFPVQCWAEENLGRIASYLGKPLCSDRLTAECERLSYARVLIEMDITQPMPNEMVIEKPDGSTWEQAIEYEWQPKFCVDCNSFGHLAGECKVEMVVPKKKNRRRRREYPTRQAKDVPPNKPTTPGPSTVMQNTSGEPVAEVNLQVNARGKQTVVAHKAPHIDPAVMAQKNNNAALQIGARPPDIQQQDGMQPDHSQRLSKGGIPTTISPI